MQDTPSEGGSTVDFEYNCCRMTGYDDALGSGATLDYDEFARLVSHTDSQGYELAYVYDSMNRVTKVTDHTSIETEYTYDLMGRTSTVTYDRASANRVTSYTYDGNSNVATATYANSYKSTFTYDAGNRTTQQKIENAATPPVTQQRFDYNYSPAGLPSNTYGYSRSDYAAPKTYLIAYHVPDSAVHGARRLGNSLRFNPDYPGRAMSIGMNADAPVEKMTQSVYTRYQYEHTYDSAGNRTALVVSGTWQPARSFGYNYSAMGFLTSITENTNLPNYSASVTTDANGNITAITEMSWPGGIPTVLSNNSFEYDPRPGQRRSRHASAVTSLHSDPDFPGRAMSIGMNADAPVFLSVNSNLNIAIAHAYDSAGNDSPLLWNIKQKTTPTHAGSASR